MNPSPSSVPETRPPSSPRRRRPWRVACLGALLALGAAVYWGSATPAGFAWTLQRLAAASRGSVHLEAVHGTLWRGFELDGLSLKTRGFDADIERLAVDWQPRDVWRGRLTVDRLAAGVMTVTPHTPPHAAPLPLDLDLPLPLTVRSIQIDALTLAPSDLRFYAIHADYRYDGKRHALRVDRLTLPSGQATMQLGIASRRPFALTGQLNADGTLDGVQAAGRLTLGGSLRTLSVNGTLAGRAASGSLRATLTPFATGSTSRFQRVDLRLAGLDPQAVLPHGPRARIDLSLHAQPAAGGAIRGGLALINREPGDLASNRLPLQMLAGAFSGGGRYWRLDSWQAHLAHGTMSGSGELTDARLDVSARLAGVALREFYPSAPDDIVGGEARVSGSWSRPRLVARLGGTWLDLQTDLTLGASRQITIQRLRLGLGRGAIDVQGQAQLGGRGDFALHGWLDHADPARLRIGLPGGDINARIDAQGHLAAPLAADIRLDVERSRWSGSPLSGRLALQLVAHRLTTLAADLRLADNRVRANGAFGAPGDRVRVDLDAPSLALLGPGFAGALTAAVDVSGTPDTPVFSGRIGARRLRLPGGIAAQTLDVDGELHATTNGVFRIKAEGSGLQADGVAIERLSASGVGTRGRQRLEVTARGRYGAEPFGVHGVASGGLAGAVWRGTLQRLEVGGHRPVTLVAPTGLELGARRLILTSPARFDALGGEVVVSQLAWRGGGTIASTGHFTGVRLALLPLPLRQDVVVAGNWAIRHDTVWEGTLALRRLAGDIQYNGQALALSAAELHLSAARGIVRFNVAAQARAGRLAGEGTVGVSGLWPDARSPLTAGIRLELPSLAVLAPMAGASFELDGRLVADLSLGGALRQPHISGRIGASGLTLADRKTGIRLADGVLQARLDGRRLVLERVHFTGGDGEVLARGELGLQDDGPNARVNVSLRRFNVFDRPGRRLIVSGDADLTLVRRLVTLRGRLRADMGKIDLPRLGTPALSDDVHIKGRPPAEASAFENLPLDADLVLDLGDHFHFGGQGLDTQLTGQVRLTAHPGHAPAAQGQVRVVTGRYKAYGQDLDIEYGAVTFTGPLDNPHLNVRARRRQSSVGAGVEVSGTVMAPQIRLISTETLSDRDKLAWLVLGRAASSNTRDDSAMASAGALLAGSLNDQVGMFDDVGMSSRSERILRDGQISPAEQVVTVGRQLTQQFYLGYEFGISSAQQAVKLIIQLGKNWSLVLRAGSDASAESRYTVRFD